MQDFDAWKTLLDAISVNCFFLFTASYTREEERVMLDTFQHRLSRASTQQFEIDWWRTSDSFLIHHALLICVASRTMWKSCLFRLPCSSLRVGRIPWNAHLDERRKCVKELSVQLHFFFCHEIHAKMCNEIFTSYTSKSSNKHKHPRRYAPNSKHQLAVWGSRKSAARNFTSCRFPSSSSSARCIMSVGEIETWRKRTLSLVAFEHQSELRFLTPFFIV